MRRLAKDMLSFLRIAVIFTKSLFSCETLLYHDILFCFDQTAHLKEVLRVVRVPTG